MARCPSDHESSDPDFCDVCGRPMTGAVAEPAAAAPVPTDGGPLVCAGCGQPREGRFCEECGFDNDLAVPAAGAPVAPSGNGAVAGTWTAVVRADRAWFEEVRARKGPDADALEFPHYSPERRFELAGAQMAIGRRSRSRGTDPEIDLGGADPGVSAQHALLVAQSGGGWNVVDLNSTNGTTVGNAATPIAPHTPVRLGAGDRVKLGAWTVITVEAPAG